MRSIAPPGHAWVRKANDQAPQCHMENIWARQLLMQGRHACPGTGARDLLWVQQRGRQREAALAVFRGTTMSF